MFLKLWMSRKVCIIFLAVVLIGSTFPYILNCKSTRNVSVGVYYYPWYKQGWGNYHWNSSAEYPQWDVVDFPLLGYYSCQEENVIRQHLEWMAEIGLDFIILSWWGSGIGAFGGGSYEDESCRLIFSTIKQYEYSIKAVIMVEGFNETKTYNFPSIFNYINETFVTPYADVYMTINDKPLLCWYNSENMTGTLDNPKPENIIEIHSDNRFESRIVGHNDYVDWWFSIPCSVNDSPLPPLSKADGMICVEPRYDDYYIGRNSRFDGNYTESLYDKQWEEAIRLAREGKVKHVTIYSWNEYHERSQIEPHRNIDGQYVLSPFSKTKYYVGRIREIIEPCVPMNLAYVGVGIIIGVFPFLVYFVYKRRKLART